MAQELTFKVTELYEAPSSELVTIGVFRPVCASKGTTQVYDEDNIWDENDND